MANRVLILVIGAVVIASLVVGGLLGMQFGGSTGGVAPTVTTTPSGQSATVATPTATPALQTTTATESTPEPTATPQPTPTATPQPTPTFSASSVNETVVEQHLRAAIDEEVRGNDSLQSEATLDRMAQSHSEAMAEQGYPAHAADGLSTRARYEKFDRYNHCRVPNNDNRGIRDGEELEVVTRITLDTSGDLSEETIADRLLAEWTDDETATEKLSLQNAAKAGVGIEVTDDGYVYATVDLC